MLKNVFKIRRKNFVPFGPDEIQLISNRAEWRGSLDEIKGAFRFKPHFGWIGAIEKPAPSEGIPEEAVRCSIH